jgi:hypothetical protein
MDFNTTLELIIKDLNEACKIIDDFKSYPAVPELHIEFAKAKCKSSAEIIALLKRQENLASKPVQEEKKVTPQEIFTIEETVVEEEKIPVKTLNIAEKQPVEELVKEVEIKEVEVKPFAEKVVKTQQKPSSIIADSFTDMPTINERLGNRKSEEDVTEIIKSKHINNLRSAVGLNDKFLLIREIFDGDKSKYEQAIAKLEEVASIDAAKAIISEYSNPDDENEAMVLLLDLVKRKLNPNE